VDARFVDGKVRNALAFGGDHMNATSLVTVMLAVAHASSSLAQGLPSAQPKDVRLVRGNLHRIDTQLQTWVDSGKLAGVIAVIVRHGKVAYVASAGSLDSARQHSIAQDAVFRIYSMTKPIATTAIMQLIERGKIKLDDPVSKYIPAFANTKVYSGGGAEHPVAINPDRPVTIADLLTHTSGLTYGVFGNTPVDSIYNRAGMLGTQWTLAQFADSIAKLPLMFSPGSAFNYGLSIDVLGRVVEVVTNMMFDAYLDSAIFRPLGMTSTAFHATPAMKGRVTAVFGRGWDGQLRAQIPWLSQGFTESGRMLSGGAGLLSTIPDYLRFAQMLLNGGELDGHRVLARQTVDLMMQNHLPARLTPIFPNYPEPPGHNGFGYGGAVRLDSASAQMPGSVGTFRWSGYASTFFWIDRKSDLIAMLWSQYIPVSDIWNIDGTFQRLVYAAIR
jgi:CubicO group peptidase (beta-lactamase class C family)